MLLRSRSMEYTLDTSFSNVRTISSKTESGSFVTSHSHIIMTRHFSFSSSFLTLLSLDTLFLNFSVQYCLLVLGVVALEQFSCLCQKQPCTNIDAPVKSQNRLTI
jgi:hypothetical protein